MTDEEKFIVGWVKSLKASQIRLLKSFISKLSKIEKFQYHLLSLMTTTKYLLNRFL